MTKSQKYKAIFPLVVFGVLLWFLFFVLPKTNAGLSYSIEKDGSASTTKIVLVEIPKATHVATPSAVKAVYLTGWGAGTPSLRDRVIKLIDDTELNSVVIDIKDFSGTISFPIENKTVAQYALVEERIPNIRDLIRTLHEKNIYVIGRITVFQDPNLAKKRPDSAVQSQATGGLWKDKKGIAYLDPSARDGWDYHVALAQESYKLGFDEINFDYIRFPSDGNIADMKFPISGKVNQTASTTPKADKLEAFFKYLSTEIRKEKEHPIISADLFGMTTSNTDDLGIGQVLERTAPYFDYVSPMVYPSHYPKTFIGLANPAANPYIVVKYALGRGVTRLEAASTTPLKLRPWLQDFDLGADYTADMVRAQIKATYDVGLTSWMLWDPRNLYTRGALLVD